MAENIQCASVYRSLIVEIRPKIQSVNVAVLLQGPSTGVGLILKENGFQLTRVPGHDGKVEAVVDFPLNNLSIVTTSLNTVKYSNNFLTFRFVTNNQSGMGSFKSELLQITPANSNGTGASSFSRNVKGNLNFERGKRYSLMCVNCFKKLSSNVIFNRVLPLPSGSLSSSDFFCHGSVKYNMNPKITDLFYSKHYAELHMDIMKEHIIIEQKYFICKRCFCYLGMIVRSQSFESKQTSDTLRVWYNTVGFLEDNHLFKTLPLNDVLLIIKDIFSSAEASSVKIIFNCDGARSGTDHLLVWVMEKELNVIMDVPVYGLEVRHKVAKVLYRFEAKDAQSNEVLEWSKDLNVHNVTVSKPMINAIVRYLCKYNKLMPDDYASTGNFFFSYLLIYD